MDTLLGLFLLLLGFGLMFFGLRLFLVMLPVFAFLSGFFNGAATFANWPGGDPFLQTLAGWGVGLILGVLFALVSYLWWYAGAVIVAASAGALLASGLFALFGVDTGWVLAVVALIGAVIFAIAAISLHLPVYVALVYTALLGAFMLIAGLLLVFDRADLEPFRWGAAWVAVQDSWAWSLALIVLTAVGVMSQLRQVAEIEFPVDRWVRADAIARSQRSRAGDMEARR